MFKTSFRLTYDYKYYFTSSRYDTTIKLLLQQGYSCSDAVQTPFWKYLLAATSLATMLRVPVSYCFGRLTAAGMPLNAESVEFCRSVLYGYQCPARLPDSPSRHSRSSECDLDGASSSTDVQYYDWGYRDSFVKNKDDKPPTPDSLQVEIRRLYIYNPLKLMT